ncbi:unnamed protein product [Protopolystoma xenopodis]|uniref:Uncharacterized protein n=1 Tax=Protopolystoma xenopodis TaxID=117903 RepID=A0A3S5BS57_9PLAT|nr:unnamed protein product [Protopolystoma xenopodis]
MPIPVVSLLQLLLTGLSHNSSFFLPCQTAINSAAVYSDYPCGAHERVYLSGRHLGHPCSVTLLHEPTSLSMRLYTHKYIPTQCELKYDYEFLCSVSPGSPIAGCHGDNQPHRLSEVVPLSAAVTTMAFLFLSVRTNVRIMQFAESILSEVIRSSDPHLFHLLQPALLSIHLSPFGKVSSHCALLPCSLSLSRSLPAYACSRAHPDPSPSQTSLSSGRPFTI